MDSTFFAYCQLCKHLDIDPIVRQVEALVQIFQAEVSIQVLTLAKEGRIATLELAQLGVVSQLEEAVAARVGIYSLESYH